MKEKLVDESRLDACGWNSFKSELFFEDKGRTHRNIGDDFIHIIRTLCKGDRILELCSGGGKLLIHLARHGLKVTGIDLSKDMLNICRMNIEKEPKSVRDRIQIFQDDICTFSINKVFDFIILEDDGFMYLLTKDDQLSCLKRVHAHLSDTGLFFLSFATPQKELNAADEYEYDAHNQIKTQPCIWTIDGKDGNLRIVKQGIERRRLTYPEELESLFTMSKLSPISCWGDLHLHPFTDPLTQEYNYLIKKQSG
jgi:SAM-dependent methyltransferase